MKHVLGIDAAKFFGIGLIILAHVDQIIGITDRIATGQTAKILERLFHVMGYYGVSLFLVASGFGLALSLLNKQQISWRKWYLRKVGKIYILFWLSYAFFLAFFFIGHRFWHGIPPTSITLMEFITTLFGIQVYFGYWGGHINAVYWFNTLIISLYAIFPLLFLFLRKFRAWKIILIFLASFIISYLVISQDWKMFIYFFPDRLFEFSFGIMAAHFYFHKKELFAKKIYSLLCFAFAVIIFIVYFNVLGNFMTVFLVLLTGPLLFSGFVFLMEKISLQSFIAKILHTGAQYSHALFLFHLPFFAIWATHKLTRWEFILVYIFSVIITTYFGQRLANKLHFYFFK